MRMIFTASTEYKNVCANSNVIKLDKVCDIEILDNGNKVWTNVKDINIGDCIFIFDDSDNTNKIYSIKDIKNYDNYIIINY